MILYLQPVKLIQNCMISLPATATVLVASHNIIADKAMSLLNQKQLLNRIKFLNRAGISFDNRKNPWPSWML